jgi:hypothetical protein
MYHKNKRASIKGKTKCGGKGGRENGVPNSYGIFRDHREITENSGKSESPHFCGKGYRIITTAAGEANVREKGPGSIIVDPAVTPFCRRG